jgi:ankyrin repeat protein
MTPLDSAISMDDFESAQRLIDLGAPVSQLIQPNLLGETHLHRLLGQRDSWRTQQFLSQNMHAIPPEAFLIQTQSGENPIHYAARYGSFQFLHSAVAPAAWSQWNRQGVPPAELFLKRLAMMQKFGLADLSARTAQNLFRYVMNHAPQEFWEAKDLLGRNAVHSAIELGLPGALEQFSTKLRLDALIHPDWLGNTPLHRAAQRGQSQSIESLLRTLPPQQLTRSNKIGQIPLRPILRKNLVGAVPKTPGFRKLFGP